MAKKAAPKIPTCSAQRREYMAVNLSVSPIRLKCNRGVYHEGPHRKVDPRTFAVLAEWSDADSVVPTL